MGKLKKSLTLNPETSLVNSRISVCATIRCQMTVGATCRMSAIRAWVTSSQTLAHQNLRCWEPSLKALLTRRIARVNPFPASSPLHSRDPPPQCVSGKFADHSFAHGIPLVCLIQFGVFFSILMEIALSRSFLLPRSHLSFIGVFISVFFFPLFTAL